MKKVACIILAAGRGTRMKSELPKVLHPLCERPMLGYVLDLVRDLKIRDMVAVLGFKHKLVQSRVEFGTAKPVIQKKQRGTADAVRLAMPRLRRFKGTVLVLYGDIPLLRKATIEELLKYHKRNNLDATILTMKLEKPQGYGRVLRDKCANISGIIEEKDADDFQKEIKEVNTGILCLEKDKLESALRKVRPDNRKREYYLTDVISILYEEGGFIQSVNCADTGEALGINSRLDLAKANSIMQRRINEGFMQAGVNIIDPATTFISHGTTIGKDTVIYPFTVIDRNVTIGNRCFIGPFAHLREDTVIHDDVTAGNFIETVRSRVGSKTFAKHFCYLGDAKVGAGVNIGAGTVVANFDGKDKHETVVKDGAFVGSDSVLIAPVKVGKGALIGAGSVVTRDVQDKTKVMGVPARSVTLRGK